MVGLSLPFPFGRGPAREPADCRILMGDSASEALDLYPMLVSLEARLAREPPSEATLVFDTQRDADGRWLVQDGGLRPWQKITLEAVFGRRRDLIFKGFISTIQASYPESRGEARVTVRCLDSSAALDRQRRYQTWGDEAPTNDRKIFADVLGRNGLRLDEESSGPGLSGLTLHQAETDLSFLRRRAAANGYELLFLPNGTVHFGPMRLDLEPQPVVMFYAGDDTSGRSLEPAADGHRAAAILVQLADADGNVSTRRVSSKLRRLGTEPFSTAAAGLGPVEWGLERPAGADEAALSARARGRADREAMGLKLTGELDGTAYGHVLRVGEPVWLDGIGPTFGGRAYVDQVTHRIDQDGYAQNVTLLRNAYGEEPAAGGGPADALAAVR